MVIYMLAWSIVVAGTVGLGLCWLLGWLPNKDSAFAGPLVAVLVLAIGAALGIGVMGAVSSWPPAYASSDASFSKSALTLLPYVVFAGACSVTVARVTGWRIAAGQR